MVNWVSHRDRKTGRRGWSLIELLVVLAIISILGVISVPIMRSFSRDDMRNGARTVYSMLRAARVYAMSYNVETAVVYELDNNFFSSTPMVDSLRNMQVRCIRAAQVMYRLPDAVGLWPDITPAAAPAWNGTFIPLPTSAGESVTFADGYSLLLEVPAPEYAPNDPPQQVYKADDTAINLWQGVNVGDLASEFLVNYHPGLDLGIERLGMRPVYVFTGTLMDYTEGEKDIARDIVHPRIAHVFEPRGNLLTNQSKERYVLLFGPSPDTFTTDRVWYTSPPYNDPPYSEVTEDILPLWISGASLPVGYEWLTQPTTERYIGLFGIPIEIHRATGRAMLGS